jgi:hypothetical protein
LLVFCFLLLSDTKKTMFYVLQSIPKLDYTFEIEISVLFSKIESHDVPYLSWGLVRDTLSGDRSSTMTKFNSNMYIHNITPISHWARQRSLPSPWSSMARSVSFGVRSRKWSNVGQSWDEWPKIYYLELLRASEGTSSRYLSALGRRGELWPVLLMCNPQGRSVPQQ